MSDKIRPMNDRVLVKRLDAVKQTPGGIFIPDSILDKPTEALVIAVGPGKVLESGRRLEPNVKAGDKILFGKYDGNEVRIDGEDHLILREDEILAILESA